MSYRFRAMKRWLFNILAPSSLMICVTITAFWVRSGYVGDVWKMTRPDGEYWVRSNWGRVRLIRIDSTSGVSDWEYESGSGGYDGQHPGPIGPQTKLPGILIAWGASRVGTQMGPTL